MYYLAVSNFVLGRLVIFDAATTGHHRSQVAPGAVNLNNNSCY